MMPDYQNKATKPKIGVPEVAKQFGNVSQARKAMGYCRYGLEGLTVGYVGNPQP